MDKCPSIIILGQTISDLFGHIFGEVYTQVSYVRIQLRARHHTASGSEFHYGRRCGCLSCAFCMILMMTSYLRERTSCAFI